MKITNILQKIKQFYYDAQNKRQLIIYNQKHFKYSDLRVLEYNAQNMYGLDFNGYMVCIIDPKTPDIFKINNGLHINVLELIEYCEGNRDTSQLLRKSYFYSPIILERLLSYKIHRLDTFRDDNIELFVGA